MRRPIANIVRRSLSVVVQERSERQGAEAEAGLLKEIATGLVEVIAHGHLSLVICHWSFVTGHLSLVICHWSFVIGHWLYNRTY
jgi:signal transduction protein with GAF and PtsI domain